MRSRIIVGAAVVVAIMLAGVYAARWFNDARAHDGLVIVNGRIEGDSVVVASKVAGRLVFLGVREGNGVEEGEKIAEIDSKQLQAQVNQALAVQAARMGNLAAAESVVLAAENQLHKAEADRVAAKARQVKALLDAGRGDKLFADGVIPKADLDQLVAARDVAVADVKAAEQQVLTALRTVAVAKAEVAAQKDQVAAARAALATARANLDDTRILSPIDGVVTTKVAEQGEVLQPGSPIVVLVNLDRLHMKAYVPEPDIGRVKLGDRARVYVDSYPNRPFAARVGEIAPRSEFTPKEVQTRTERVKQVIAVKLYLDSNPGHMLVPGMPADAVVRTNPQAQWIAP
jgi:membrane fusion protein YbhG